VVDTLRLIHPTLTAIQVVLTPLLTKEGLGVVELTVRKVSYQQFPLLYL